MFYSNTFLARKGPLGTIWIAAHLQHKLRKPQVTSINIPSSVDTILYADVPIALRLSGHLLLGVVRIFSKKVDYLYHDCNEVMNHLRTLLASVHVNLPVDGESAPIQSITLPETFELDALDMDDMANLRRGLPDNHLKAYDQITLLDQVQVEGNQYTTFFLDEDLRVSPQPGIPDQGGLAPMDEDLPPLPESDDIRVTGEVPISGIKESNRELYESHLPEESPDILRAAESLGPNQPGGIFPDFDNGIIEEREPFELAIKGTPTLDQQNDNSFFRDGLLSSQLHNEPLSAVSMEANGNSDLGPDPWEVALQPSPPVLQPTTPNQRQRPKSRKRKQFFDESIVLSNQFMKKQLNNASKLVRKRNRAPCSNIDIWMVKRSRMDQIFLRPSVSGTCDDLQEVFKRKAQLECEQTPAGRSVDQPEVEEPLFETGFVADTVPEMVPSPAGELQTPSSAGNLESGLQFENTAETMISQGTEVLEKTAETDIFSASEDPDSVPQIQKSVETEILHGRERLETIFELESSSVKEGLERVGSTEILPGMDGPSIAGSVERPVADETPDFRPHLAEEDLSFLEADNSQAGLDGNGVNSLPVRTRAVAQYLVKKALRSQHAGDVLVELSLSSILEGRTRKECARMFFETLVLSTDGFVDVYQEAGYSDIKISVTPALEKSQILNP